MGGGRHDDSRTNKRVEEKVVEEAEGRRQQQRCDISVSTATFPMPVRFCCLLSLLLFHRVQQLHGAGGGGGGEGVAGA